MTANILIVDDEKDSNSSSIKELLKTSTHGSDYDVDFATNGLEALDKVRDKSYDLLILDLRMPKMDGFELFEELKKRNLLLSTLILSAYCDTAPYYKKLHKLQQENNNILDLFTKSAFPIQKLIDRIAAVFNKDSLSIVEENLSNKIKEEREKFYSELNPKVAETIKKRTEVVRRLNERAFDLLIQQGQELIKIQNELKEERLFVRWLEIEYPHSDSSVYRLINGAKKIKEFQEKYKDELKDTDFSKIKLGSSVFSYLSQITTPLEAVREILNLCLKEQYVSIKTAQQIIGKYKALSSGDIEKISLEIVTVFPEIDNNIQTINQSVLQPSQSSLQITQPNQIIQNSEKNPPKPLILGGLPLKKNNWWQLGKHLLYCGNPNSPSFKKKLSGNAALAIVFPPHTGWDLDLLPADSKLVFHSNRENLDLEKIRESIAIIIEITTVSNESVIFAYISDPELLLIADDLDCCGFLVQPDFKKCESIINFWQQQGKTVEALPL
jgi:CheY-like chemotaxis protein